MKPKRRRSTASAARRTWCGILLAVLAMTTSLGTAGDGPPPARRPLGPDNRMQISEADRCPVCAMFPSRYPQTAAAMQLNDGTTFYFCSNGCLLRAWLRPGAYLGRSRTAVGRLVVSDYFSGRPVDGRAAVWVAGSDVIGPMGPAVVALGDANHLTAFKQRHGATIVFRLDALDDTLWQRISHHRLPAAHTR